jgi:serine phosphatase RsbU (regulator of sigma subunit)
MSRADEDVRRRLLLVEDDDGDALIVEELLIDSGEAYDIARARSIAAAADLVTGADCALVDLGLPDAAGLSAVEQLRAYAPGLAIVVLTGLTDKARGLEAVAAGAQDYLVKGRVDPEVLARAIRYAIERRRAEHDNRRLLIAEHRQGENARLARGLLPQLDVEDPFAVATCYRPGADALLGGDFYDALVTPDGRLRAVIGDVCGHGPAEAALGVALRIAWRTMTLAGVDSAETLAAMEQVAVHERDENLPFATVCDVTVDPAAGTLTVRRHGHPPPLLLAGSSIRWIDEAPAAPPLACVGPVPAKPVTVPLPVGWRLLLLTDGLYEGHGGAMGRDGDGRLGMEGLVDLITRLGADAAADALLDGLVTETRRLNGGDLADDLALLWIGTHP